MDQNLQVTQKDLSTFGRFPFGQIFSRFMILFLCVGYHIPFKEHGKIGPLKC